MPGSITVASQTEGFNPYSLGDLLSWLPTQVQKLAEDRFVLEKQKEGVTLPFAVANGYAQVWKDIESLGGSLLGASLYFGTKDYQLIAQLLQQVVGGQGINVEKARQNSLGHQDLKNLIGMGLSNLRLATLPLRGSLAFLKGLSKGDAGQSLSLFVEGESDFLVEGLMNYDTDLPKEIALAQMEGRVASMGLLAFLPSLKFISRVPLVEGMTDSLPLLAKPPLLLETLAPRGLLEGPVTQGAVAQAITSAVEVVQRPKPAPRPRIWFDHPKLALHRPSEFALDVRMDRMEKFLDETMAQAAKGGTMVADGMPIWWRNLFKVNPFEPPVLAEGMGVGTLASLGHGVAGAAQTVVGALMAMAGGAVTLGINPPAYAALDVSMLTYNARLFGMAGMIVDEVGDILEHTKLVDDDGFREDYLWNRLSGYLFDEGPKAKRRLLRPCDFIGLTEIWDGRTADYMLKKVRRRYPFAVVGPHDGGIPKLQEVILAKSEEVTRFLLQAFPQLESIEEFIQMMFSSREALGVILPILTDAIVLANTRILTGEGELERKIERQPTLAGFGGVEAFGQEDIFRDIFLRNIMGDEKVFGSGLLFLSRHPIEETQFYPFSRGAGVDAFAKKGVLKTVVRLRDGRRLTILLTHLQQGTSSLAQEVRGGQIDLLQNLVQTSPHLVIVMGDLNIMGEDIGSKEKEARWTGEYQRLLTSLGLVDAYAQTHPQADFVTSHTFDNGSSYNQRLGLDQTGQRYQRLDYILVDTRLGVTKAFVDRETFQYFRDPNDYYQFDRYNERARPFSDHFPLVARVRLP